MGPKLGWFTVHTILLLYCLRACSVCGQHIYICLWYTKSCGLYNTMMRSSSTYSRKKNCGLHVTDACLCLSAGQEVMCKENYTRLTMGSMAPRVRALPAAGLVEGAPAHGWLICCWLFKELSTPDAFCMLCTSRCLKRACMIENWRTKPWWSCMCIDDTWKYTNTADFDHHTKTN